MNDDVQRFIQIFESGKVAPIQPARERPPVVITKKKDDDDESSEEEQNEMPAENQEEAKKTDEVSSPVKSPPRSPVKRPVVKKRQSAISAEPEDDSQLYARARVSIKSKEEERSFPKVESHLSTAATNTIEMPSSIRGKAPDPNMYRSPHSLAKVSKKILELKN